MTTLDLAAQVTQAQFGGLVGLSEPEVSKLVAAGVLDRDAPVARWVRQYVEHLRQRAAGRSVELTEQRARYDRARADWQEMVNAEKRKQLVPAGLLERIVAQVGRRIAAILEGVPARLRREVQGIDAAALAVIEEELVRARNEAASMQLDWAEVDGSIGDRAGATERVEGAAGAPAAAPVAVG